MRLDIRPDGIGPVTLGMRPADVLALFPEQQKWESWMGGNLNDALLFHGLVFGFSDCDSRAPLPNSRLESIIVRDREGAEFLERPLASWRREELLARLRELGRTVELLADASVAVHPNLVLWFENEERIQGVSVGLWGD
jgi:hypothetical protein